MEGELVYFLILLSPPVIVFVFEVVRLHMIGLLNLFS